MHGLLRWFLRLLRPSFLRTASVSQHATVIAEQGVLVAPDWRSISHPEGLSVHCLAGQAALVQEGDPRELLLVSGDRYVVPRDEHVYLQAVGDAEFRYAMTLVLSKGA